MGRQFPAAETPEDVAKCIHDAAVFLWREATSAGLYDLAASLSAVARQARDDATDASPLSC